MNDSGFPKTFDPHAVEQQLYEKWERENHFKPSGHGAPYCIMIPPPNVTGSLHMGHAFQNTLMDALIRYHRMKGRNTLWQAGTDHAGIATQIVVERQLNDRGATRTELGRDRFIEEIWKWKAHSGGTITRQLRRLGASLDWSRERFTMDEDLSGAVREVFVSLYEQGLIYRGKRLVNWDPVLLTAISDLEVVAESESSHLWEFRYPIADSDRHVVIATTRPETMLGDTAVAVHPDDKRYRDLVGKTVRLPITGRLIPIIADEYVDPEFGTGCVKITPAHDFNDFQVGQRAGLDVINIMTPNAEIDLPGSPYHGLDRFEARSRIVSDLERQGLVESIQPHTYNVPRGDRTGVVIEPYLTDQWFVKAKPLAEPAIEAVRSGSIRFVPENWERTYFDWMENIEDWCISRQIWWGHRIPAWYDEDGNAYVARSERDAQSLARERHGGKAVALTQDSDVLDTWFSSALWPFSTLGWPADTKELDTFYTTSVLVTGFDIIFFWVARMIMFGLKFTGEKPFHEIYIHGLVRDSEGQKMSKSKGNILDPLDLIDGIELPALIEKRTSNLMQPDLAPKIKAATIKQFPDGIPSYGADALRFTFASLATQGRDIRFDLGRIEGYRNFCNKLWNAARFVLMNREGAKLGPTPNLDSAGSADKWILARLQQVESNVEQAFSAYRFDMVAKHLHQFAWGEFCNWYIEFAKISLSQASSTEAQRETTRLTLLYVLEALLRLLHPIMPYITEEIWQHMPFEANDGQERSIMLQPYFTGSELPIDENACREIDWVKDVVSAIRNVRGELNVKPDVKLEAFFENASEEGRKFIERNLDSMLTLCRLKSFNIASSSVNEDEYAVALIDSVKILVRVDHSENAEEQIQKLRRDIDDARRQIERSETKLSNDEFVAKAPQPVVDKERDRLARRQAELIELEKQLQRLQAAQS